MIEDGRAISTVQEIIEEAKNGRMFILVDDEDRENEGDLIVPAQMATPDIINFMATHGRGLICLAMTAARVAELGLPPMSPQNGTRHETAFTVSIEAREGVTTGISAADRARTISAAIGGRKEDIVTPGHVFPLSARDGGVLERAGHTEAAVDISRLAGLNPAGVICEIMKDDGSMARLDDLIFFARTNRLKIGTIRDLIAYRSRHDRLVRRAAELPFDSEWGGHWKAITYQNVITGSEQISLLMGPLDPQKPMMVRMHTHSYMADSFGELSERGGLLRQAMGQIAEYGQGAVVMVNRPIADAISRGMKARAESVSNFEQTLPDLRDYGIGAQILADLGVHNMILLTNSHQNLIGLSGHGLNIVEERAIGEPAASPK